MATEKQADAIIKHQTHISRYGAGSANRLLKILQTGEIEAILNSNKTVKQKTKQIQKVIAKQKKKSDKYLTKELKALYDVEYNFVSGLLKETLEQRKLKKVTKSLDEIIDTALNKPLVGQPGAKTLTPQEMYESVWESLENQSTGYVRTEAIVEGTPADVILPTPSAVERQFARGLASAVRTASFATTEQMREELYQANDDVLRGVILAATLDGRTTKFCMKIDGTILPLKSTLRPPFHVNCRTTAIPISKNETDEEAIENLQVRTQVAGGPNYEVGEKIAQKKTSRKNVKDGIVKVKATDKPLKSGSNYQNFLEVQVHTKGGKNFIRDTMGVKKGNAFIKLVQEGKQTPKTMARLIDLDGRTLTLEQLMKRSTN